MKNFYCRLHSFARALAPGIYKFAYKHKSAVKYIFSGGMATFTNLATLFILGELFHWHYLSASITAFALSIVVSFSMQKFWAFEDKTTDSIHAQFAVYLLIVLANLAINTFLVYAMVEWFSVWYILAQLLAGGAIAAISFFLYRNIVFKKP